MQIPEWLLILLTCFSTILILVVFVVSYHLLKHWLHVRKYEKIRSSKNTKYVPGKTEAYFQGKYERSYSFLPSTYLTTIQSGTPLIRPTFKMESLIRPMFKTESVPDSVSSRSSSYHSRNTIGATFGRRLTPISFQRCYSMDDQYFRKTFQNRSGIDYKRIESPLTVTSMHSSQAGSDSRGSSRRSSLNEGYGVYSTENTPDRGILHNIYSHSDFLPGDESTLVVEPVVSYDQEHVSSGKANRPGSLSFLLEYHSSAPELLITIKHALDLPSATGNVDGCVNSHVNLCIVPEDFLWKRTRIVENDRDPVYNETFKIRDVLYHKLREYTICFYVMDSHLVLGERVIGKVLYPLSDLRAEQIVEVCKELSLA